MISPDDIFLQMFSRIRRSQIYHSERAILGLTQPTAVYDPVTAEQKSEILSALE
jgi:hypothetical protein